MHSWHDVNPCRISKDHFLALIEISKGSKNKYELDKETGHLILDRILFTSTVYPQNYGFIPLTYAKDNDPLDVLVVCTEPILPMSFVECKPIGVMIMKDGEYDDEKIIAVPVKDPLYRDYNDISEIPPHVMEEIKHFFSVYKTLEGKTTQVDKFYGVEQAKSIIEEAMKSYQEIIAPKRWKWR